MSNNTSVRKAMSLAPLIDVVFILLLFFMLSTQFITRSTIPMDIKRSNQSASSQTTNTLLVIRLLVDNQVSVDGRVMSITDDNLSRVLDTEFSDGKDAALQFEGDANVQTMTQLLDIINQLSIESDRIRMGW